MFTVKTNSVILSSIPIDREVKKYWIRKCRRIAQSSGVDEAQRKFKHFLQVMRRYVSDPHRTSNRLQYMKESGFRQNGMLLKLFLYADCQPHNVLNLLKMYSGLQPVMSKESRRAWAESRLDHAIDDCHERLQSVHSCPAVPKFMSRWIDIVTGYQSLSSEWDSSRLDPKDPFYKVSRLLTREQWCQYFGTYRSRMRRTKDYVLRYADDSHFDYVANVVYPNVYCDYTGTPLGAYSATFNQDVGNFFSALMVDEDPMLSNKSLMFIADNFLNEGLQDEFYNLMWGSDTSDYSGVFRECNMAAGRYVGQVHHIVKKGSPFDFRDIAVPNRLVQAALVPIFVFAYDLAETFKSHQAMTDQNRFDFRIAMRVNNDNLYQGSVDLSKATDNLPRDWVFYLMDRLVPDHQEIAGAQLEAKLLKLEGKKPPFHERFVDRSGLVQGSYDLFKEVCSSYWYNEGYLEKWTVGQPLGSLPSFSFLTLTHVIYLESLALSLCYTYSPYYVLGDDVVITKKKLRKAYIRDLVSRGIPLSLDKSYSGRLSEFAGKTFIKGQMWAYTPDQSPITWNNFLDYQRVSGIRIPWRNLPPDIRHRWTRRCQEFLPSELFSADNASKAYKLFQSLEVCNAAGTYPEDIPKLAIESYFAAMAEQDPRTGVVNKTTGVVIIGDGHPVVLGHTRFADHDGYFHQYRELDPVPKWKRHKYGSFTTDKICSSACSAVEFLSSAS